MGKVKVSIMVVNYKVEELLVECLSSITSSSTRTKSEILVIDNSPSKNFKSRLKKKFPSVKYIRNKNLGFGQANNTGVKFASGEYLFFLNPDTVVLKGCIEELVGFLDKNKKVGVVAPLLVDRQQKPYELQGTKILTPRLAIFSLSFLNRVFPNNKVSRSFWNKGWNKTKLKEVGVVPGTAFMIRKDIFDKAGGFDENYFLYFEEFDLALRVKDLGFKLFINPAARIVHYWGESTKKSRKDIQEIFEKSRFYYFKKNFGLINALVVSSFLSLNKSNLPIFLIVLVGLFLRLYKLGDLMTFISDQAWFFLSAKDLIHGNIPLVGITSSHTWLHQGPLWTYMIAPFLWIWRFNPLGVGYLSVFLDIATIIAVYKVGKEVFTKNVGFISAILYAFSPLAILYARMPYHTSPIPLLSILFFYALYKWTSGNKIFFAILCFLCALLYNFELANVLFGFILFAVLIYGTLKRASWSKIFTRKIILLSAVLTVIVMLPVLIYDVGHGFPQTVKFLGWIVAKVLSYVGPNLIGSYPANSLNSFLSYSAQNYSKLIFPSNINIAIGIFVLVFIGNLLLVLRLLNKRAFKPRFALYYFISTTLIVGFLSQRELSGAYLPMLFPYLLGLIALPLGYLLQRTVFVYLIVVALSFSNVYNILAHNYWVSGAALNPLVREARFIVEDADGRSLSIVEKNFQSNIDVNQYKYLVFYLGGNLQDNSSLIYGIHNNSEGKPQNAIYKDDFISVTYE